MILKLPRRDITFPRRPLLMGIVNINDDSFSGDGTLDPDEALEQARQHLREGADIIDIGAESARTNREAITITEEIRRLQSFLQHWPKLRDEAEQADGQQLSPPLLSINTWRPEVVSEVISSDVDILNDLSALPDDRNARLCAQYGTSLLIMHSVGQPKEAHTHQQWDQLITSMREFFEQKITLALQAGLSRHQIILDPGLDFAKQKNDNLTVLRELEKITNLACPVLLPISRKTLIGEVLDLPKPIDRDPGTIALLTQGFLKGAHIFRIHNTRACWEALKMLTPLLTKKLTVILNLAISADGKIAPTGSPSSNFTSKEDLARLLDIRKRADAILVGRGTLEADQMTMTVEGKMPWRCVISESGRIDPKHPLFSTEGGERHLIVGPEATPPKLPATIHQETLSGFIEKLKENPNIHTLLCEGGGKLVRALFELDLVDEINITWAPHTLFGGKNAPTLTGLPGDFLPASLHYQLVHYSPNKADELFLTYHRKATSC